MEDRRQFVRLDTRLPVTYRVVSSVTDAAGGTVGSGRSPGQREAVTRDVSGGGICVFLERPLPIGTRLEIQLKLRDQERPVLFTGEIMWCEAYEFVGVTPQASSVQAGIKFVQIAPQDYQRILRHVILHLQPQPPA